MKQRLITIALLVLIVISSGILANNLGSIKNVGAQDSRPLQPTLAPPGPRVQLHNFAFLPGESRDYVTAWNDEGVTLVSDANTLYSSVPDGDGSVVYLNEEALNSLDVAWMQAKYKTGVAFGAIGVPLSDLGAKVGSEPNVPTVPDLDMAHAPRGATQVAFIYESAQGNHQFFYTDYVSNLVPIPMVLERPLLPIP